MRLLLVEDDVHLAASTARLLSHHFGAEVVVAHDGLAALEIVRQGAAFDGAIVDLDLPRLDGAALLDELAALAPDLSCGLWSASPGLFGVRTTNAAFRLMKDGDVRALITTVERMLARSRRARSERLL